MSNIDRKRNEHRSSVSDVTRCHATMACRYSALHLTGLHLSKRYSILLHCTTMGLWSCSVRSWCSPTSLIHKNHLDALYSTILPRMYRFLSTVTRTATLYWTTMRGLSFFPVILALLYGLANAFPNPGEDDRDAYRHHDHICVTDKEAVDIVNAFESFYVSFNRAKADRLIADEFQSFSDSNGQVFYTNFTVCLSSVRRFPRASRCFSPSFPSISLVFYFHPPHLTRPSSSAPLLFRQRFNSSKNNLPHSLFLLSPTSMYGIHAPSSRFAGFGISSLFLLVVSMSWSWFGGKVDGRFRRIILNTILWLRFEISDSSPVKGVIHSLRKSRRWIVDRVSLSHNKRWEELPAHSFSLQLGDSSIYISVQWQSTSSFYDR